MSERVRLAVYGGGRMGEALVTGLLAARWAAPDEAADLICEAIRAKPKQINTRLGTFGEVAYALAPKAVDQILHMAYKVFPDSAASRGEKDPDEKASVEIGRASCRERV